MLGDILVGDRDYYLEAYETNIYSPWNSFAVGTTFIYLPRLLLSQPPTENTDLDWIRQHARRSFLAIPASTAPRVSRACQLALNMNMKSRKIPTRLLLTRGSIPETFDVVWYAVEGRQEDIIQA